VAEEVMSLFRSAGIEVEGVQRGLDHGVWASFKCGIFTPRVADGTRLTLYVVISAFDPTRNPLNVPIVQVSLFDTEDPVQHYRLGQAIGALREQNILIITSGMAVHNLRDVQRTSCDSTPMPYTVSFDEALRAAVTSNGFERERTMTQLLERPDARQAHPTFDHLLPIFVGAGAAGDDPGKRVWTLAEGGLSWAQYRFGQVAII